MMKFKLKRGRHSERVDGKMSRYTKGDIVSSLKDLCAIFGRDKFERVYAEEPAVEKAEKKTVKKAVPVAVPDEVEVDDEVEETAVEETESDQPKLSINIQRKGSRYNIHRTDNGDKLNDRALSKKAVDEFLLALGEIDIGTDDR